MEFFLGAEESELEEEEEEDEEEDDDEEDIFLSGLIWTRSGDFFLTPNKLRGVKVLATEELLLEEDEEVEGRR